MSSAQLPKTRSQIQSSVIMDAVSHKSQSKILQLEGTFNEDLIRSSWNAFGLYISRQMRMGRGITIPHFGIFTFSAPEVILNGVTNPIERDKQPRIPVFIVSKEFVKGKTIKSGIGNELSGIRPYSVYGVNGTIQQAKINYSEIGHYANLPKDDVKIGIERIIRQLSDKTKIDNNAEMEIPNVGIFMVRNNVCGVLFNDFLVKNTKNITQKPLEEKIRKGEMSLTADSLKKFDLLESLSRKYEDKDSGFLQIDEKAKDYLKKNLNIDLNKNQRAQSALLRSSKPSVKGDNESMKSGGLRPQTAKTISMVEPGLNKLNYWIRRNDFDTEDAFIELCLTALGKCIPTTKLTQDDLYKALALNEIELNPMQMTSLFTFLDVNKDGYLDIKDWSKVIKESGNHLQYIKDVIFKGQLKTDDVLKRMNLSREQGIVTVMVLKDALKSLDITLNDIKAYKLAQSILKNREYIDIKELIEILECVEEEGKIYDVNWFNNMLFKLKKKFDSMPDPEALRKEFEDYDDRNQGILDTANFKTCLMKVKLDLSVGEINRLCRYIDKNPDGTIDYYRFLDTVSKISKESKEGEVFRDLQDFTERLANYLKNNKISAILLIKKALNNVQKEENIGSRIGYESLASYLQSHIFNHSNYDEICKYISKADIDKDGFIDSEDLEIFLKRFKYLEKRKILSARPSLQDPNLFPKEPLDEAKADIVIRDLRQALFLKKVSFFEFFKILDSNKDGFITIEEFCLGLDKVIKFSQMIKEGFFSFMDKQKIGMIDYKTFLLTMNKSIFQKQAEVSEDNWVWQVQTIKKMREWFKEEGISLYDAFRLVDKDFDGFINKIDLKNFLREVLHFQENELTGTRLDRLFKLIDQFKRGCVQFLDFKRLIEMDLEMLNVSITGNKSPNKAFDWITNCKQQIGLVLSRQFNSLKTSFETISEHQKRLLYSQFYKWLDSSRALTGFNLTEKLVQQVFSDLDPHKKGYLTENDWLNAFGGYGWTVQMFTELKETIYTQFPDLLKAWHFFCQNKENLIELSFEMFKEGVDSLFPHRFSLSDSFWLYNKVRGDSQVIDYNTFIRSFEKIKAGKQTVPSATAKSFYKENGNKGQKPEFDEETSKIVLEKVRQILRSTNKSIDEIFRQFDSDGSGTISNVEFRNALRELNLGLSLSEIDILQNLCDENMDGLIDYREFSKKFHIGYTGERILERSKLRLQKIRNDIYSYMISPKDAFRQFNEDRTGKMTYEQFTKLIRRLCQLSQEEFFPHPILADLFSFIDIRRDGVIDLNEWMQTFKIMENKEKSIQIRPITANPILQHNLTQQNIIKNAITPFSMLRFLRPQNEVDKQNPEELLESSKWETSKQYDQIIKIIARNRKHLLDNFGNLQKKGVIINLNKAKETMAEVLRNVGLFVPEDFWPFLLKFAEREGIIDYKFMLDVYKERVSRIDSHPKLGKEN